MRTGKECLLGATNVFLETSTTMGDLVARKMAVSGGASWARPEAEENCWFCLEDKTLEKMME